MHRGLIKLMQLQARAVFRRMFRGAKTPRGLIYLIVGAILFFAWLGPSVAGAFLRPRTDPASVLMNFPLAMLGFCLMTLVTSAGERAVAFNPSEVDFLFSGPFSRRQLLAYKIARSAFAAMFTSGMFSLIFLRFARHWLTGWIGMFLALMFVQLFSMSIVLIGQTIGERAFTRGRKLMIVFVCIAIAAILGPSVSSGTQRNPQELAYEFTHSQSGRIVLAPFSVFARILTADAVLTDGLKWAGVALAEIGLMILVVMHLDAHYLEAAASTGQKVHDRIQRYRRGGGLAFQAKSASLHLPMFPRLAGAGAIAWRQLLTALRTSRSLLIVLVFVCLGAGPMLYAGGLRDHPERVVVGILFWITFMLGNMLRYDFRGDLDHMDTLKALPVHPSAIAAAELIAPVAVLTLFQLLLLISASFLANGFSSVLGLTLLFILPINAILIAVENLIFLIFPVRNVTVSPGDLQGFGRQMLMFMLKTMVLMLSVGIAAGLGAVAYFVSHRSISALVAVTFFALVLEFLAMIPLLVLAFRKFDLSVDTPA
jgi:hypothetical protein